MRAQLSSLEKRRIIRHIKRQYTKRVHHRIIIFPNAYEKSSNHNQVPSSKVNVPSTQVNTQLRSSVIGQNLHTQDSRNVESIDIVDVIRLPIASSLREGKDALIAALQQNCNNQRYDRLKSGLLRYEIRLPVSIITPLQWLEHQRQSIQNEICLYYSGRLSSAPGAPGMEISQSKTKQLQSVAGVGAAWLEPPQHGWSIQYKSIQRFLQSKHPEIRAFVALRFNPDGDVDPEWEEFGQGIFMLPQIEFKFEQQYSMLAVNVAWRSDSEVDSFQQAAQNALSLLQQMNSNVQSSNVNIGTRVGEQADAKYEYVPTQSQWNQNIDTLLEQLQEDYSVSPDNLGLDDLTAFREYLDEGQGGLDSLIAAMQTQKPDSIHDQLEQSQKLTKVVLARKTKFSSRGSVDPLGVLQLQSKKNPRAYQLAILLPSGKGFVSCTPERLFVRSGRNLATEAVAGTRPRGPKGDLQKDFAYSMDLLRNPKDHAEFCAVRDWVQESLESISEEDSVVVEREKSLLKQETVQHLYGCLSGRIKQGITDGDILRTLHPTPAVCGRPQPLAMKQISHLENFDRGLYAGPVGWISGDASEFAVAIRSSLFHPVGDENTDVTMYSGVGVVKKSDADSEWNELNLKVKSYQEILRPPISMFQIPNINLVWMHLLFEELVRQGVDTVCLAPGSRSSPLVYAAAQNPQTKIVTCIDERSLGFWALGYGKARNRPAVIVTSSGTAVANLLPSVIEASQSNVPMIVCTADRPLELHDTGANQTIDQVDIYGKYVRYEQSLDAPSTAVPARAVLTTVGNACRHAMGGNPGPVHLNWQFREPLAPTKQEWDVGGKFMKGVGEWERSMRPYTGCSMSFEDGDKVYDSGLQEIVAETERGLIVVGELCNPAELHSILKLSSSLGWAMVADVLAGVRVGSSSQGNENSPIIFHMDHLLLDKEHWSALQPSTIFLFGNHLTSKRVHQFMEWCALESDRPSNIVQFSNLEKRNDPSHIVSKVIIGNIPSIQQLRPSQPSQQAYNRLLRILNTNLSRRIRQRLESTSMNEPHIAHTISQMLPKDHALFLGNSMPIRDMDMYSQPMLTQNSSNTNVIGVPIGSNRGASGIDGVISTTVGFAAGHNRPVTLLIGDISFLHDSNGLMFLTQSSPDAFSVCPVTVVAINNQGGGIFEFLPLVDQVEKEQMDHLWVTPQHTDLGTLCKAHGVLHMRVKTLDDFRRALSDAWLANQHNVVEVVTTRESNRLFHRELQQLCQTETRKVFERMRNLQYAKFTHFGCTPYALPLIKPLTTEDTSNQRQGFVVEAHVKFEDGFEGIGRGEIAPLPGLHKESLAQCLGQLAALNDMLRNVEISPEVVLFNGSMHEFWWGCVGIRPGVLFPSVRFGVEMALVDALEKKQSLSQDQSKTQVISNGLIGACEVEEAVNRAKQLVEEGYSCLKIKVGTRSDPTIDAQVVGAIRQAVGPEIVLRADANRRWTLDQAITFGHAVYLHELQYIEEPVTDPSSFENFYLATGVPYAIDETLDQVLRNARTDSQQENFHCQLQSVIDMYNMANGLRAIIVKPMVVGSVDRVIEIARFAKSICCDSIISSCFESSVGIAFHRKLAEVSDSIQGKRQYHGLGTLDWFDERYRKSLPYQSTQQQPEQENSQPNGNVINNSNCVFKNLIRILPNTVMAEGDPDKPAVVFLHGMFGAAEDWTSVMRQVHVTTNRTCIAIDLHSEVCSIEDMTDMVIQTLQRLPCVGQCGVVGYSMGGRAAQHILVNKPDLFKFGILISSSPGIEDETQRQKRVETDSFRAQQLLRFNSLRDFLDQVWYQSEMWGEMKYNARYQQLLDQRSIGDVGLLAKTFERSSPGRQDNLWTKLDQIDVPILSIVGEKDVKYCNVQSRMESLVNKFEAVQFNAGHAVHFERPLELALEIIQFLERHKL